MTSNKNTQGICPQGWSKISLFIFSTLILVSETAAAMQIQSLISLLQVFGLGTFILGLVYTQEGQNDPDGFSDGDKAEAVLLLTSAVLSVISGCLGIMAAVWETLLMVNIVNQNSFVDLT